MKNNMNNIYDTINLEQKKKVHAKIYLNIYKHISLPHMINKTK
jgi:hypothetical protein